MAEALKRWREANKEKVNEYQRRWYHANKEKIALKYAENTAGLRSIKWHEEHPPEIKQVKKTVQWKRKDSELPIEC